MQHASIYIASTEVQSGALIVAIGFMEMLKGRYTNVALFRPIVPDRQEEETHIGFMREHFGLKIPYDACYGFTESEVIQAFAHNEEERLFASLMRRVEALHKEYDFVLIDGYPRNRFASTFDFDINLKIAKNLGTAFVPVISARGKRKEEVLNEIQIITEAIQAEGCRELATFVNRCDRDLMRSATDIADTFSTPKQIYLLPDMKEVDTPTLRQIVHALDATMILGSEAQLNHLVHKSKIAAMGVENYLLRIADGHLIIVPADRDDIILASLLSYTAKNHPNIVAMVLSGGINPSETVINLIKDFAASVPIPLFTVESDSYETAITVAKVRAKISPEESNKITLVKALFDKHVDKEKIAEKFRKSQNTIVTPLMFEYALFEQARSRRQRILLPESDDERILKAAATLLQREIADIILLGKEEDILHHAAQLRIDISNATIIDPSQEKLQKSFSRQFQAMRASKGLTLDAASDAMEHKNYFAAMMLYTGMADGLVSGAVHTTADTIRPALQIIKTKPDISIVSSIFFMLLETKILVYGDCAINLDPDAEALAHIAISSADTAAQFGIAPRVAMLSYSTGDSGSGPEVEKVREATKIAQQLRPDLLIEGPIQYDAAIDTNVAKKKLPHSKVAGHATVFVFPDLNTGNNTYKAVQRSTGATAIGPILQGLKLPVNDLSRGASVEDIVNTVAITAVQAQQLEKQ